VSTSAAGRAEDAAGGAIGGSVAIAAGARLSRAGGGTVVVLGSAESASSAIAGRGLGAADLLVAQVILRLAGRVRAVAIADKTPEQVRLGMTSSERTAVVALCAGAIPPAYAAPGRAVVVLPRRASGAR